MSEEKRDALLLTKEMQSACTGCGECLKPCRFLQKHGTPATIASNAMAGSNLLSAFGCSLCGLCDAVCPEGLSPSSMFLAMRQEAVSRSLVDLKLYSPWLNYEKTGGSFFFRRDFIPDGCKTVFFPGCSLPGSRPAAVMALFSKLRQLEPDSGLVLDCCGKISHDLGMTDRFNSIFSKLTDRLKKEGVKRILTSCPGCSKILQKYAEGFEIGSIYELLSNTSSITVPEASGRVVAIHDPCTARFDFTQQRAVRRLVSSSGYAIEELPSNTRTTRCCGQGGMVEAILPGTVRQESEQIASEVAGKHLVTSCGACCDTLSGVTKTLHVADLLTGNVNFESKPLSSVRRWINRLKLRFARLT
jgi:Fe-S oxidoreductase